VKTIDEMILSDADLRRRILEIAVDAAWGIIESNSVSEYDGAKGGTEWMDLGDLWMDLGDFRADTEVELLRELGLLAVHPAHANWVREIAEL
jgi:hypothetical protein